MKKEKVYISGAMSGVDRPVYRRRFIAAETMLQAKGYKTYNPIRFVYARWHWLYKLLGYKWVLLLDLWMLSRCDKIYVIPVGSRLSLGVRAEVNFARALHIPFFNDNGNDNDNGNSREHNCEVLADDAPRGSQRTSDVLRESATANGNNGNE